MRIVQRNKKHKGYALYKISEQVKTYIQIEPLFTDDVLLEAREIVSLLVGETGGKVSCIGVYIVSMYMENTLKKIKEFKKEFGIIPQNYTEELRTGVSTEEGLVQSIPRFFYK